MYGNVLLLFGVDKKKTKKRYEDVITCNSDNSGV